MGQLREIVPDGSRVTAYNNSGSTIARGLGVRRSGAGDDQCALLAAATNPAWGVTVGDIPTGTRGTIQNKGRVIAVCSAAISVGAAVECGTDGKFVPHSSGTKWGIALTATTNTGDEFELDLSAAATAVS